MSRRVGRRLLRLVGRPVRCERCGDVLFRGRPVIVGGHLWLLGAEQAVVRVDWRSRRALAFRHVDLDRCRRPPPDGGFLPVSRLGGGG